MKRMLFLAALVLILPTLALSDSANSFPRPVNISQLGGSSGVERGEADRGSTGPAGRGYIVGGKIIVLAADRVRLGDL